MIDIFALEAGHELNALIDEHIFKREMCAIHHSLICCGRGGGDWSGKIAPAWEVVEKLSELGGLVSVCWGHYGDDGEKASVMTLLLPDACAVGATAPLAICRAALLAAMGADDAQT